MTEDEAVDQIAQLEKTKDTEGAHELTDDLIIAFLRDAGYVKLAQAFDNLHKWYG